MGEDEKSFVLSNLIPVLLNPRDAVVLATATSKSIRDEVDLACLFGRLCDEAGLAKPPDESGRKEVFRRHMCHRAAICTRCGRRSGAKSTVDSSPLEGRYMHLCHWLTKQPSGGSAPRRGGRPPARASSCERPTPQLEAL